MKLLQQIAVFEGQGPVPAKLTLAEIIRSGKVTNPYQSFMLGVLSEFFKNGNKSLSLQLEAPINFESKATTSALVSEIRSMTPEEHVQLAQYLSDCIDAGESALHDQSMDLQKWIKYVLHAQR